MLDGAARDHELDARDRRPAERAQPAGDLDTPARPLRLGAQAHVIDRDADPPLDSHRPPGTDGRRGG